MQNIAISIGDLNGIGIQIAIECHKIINKICNPIYCIDKSMLIQGANLLGTSSNINDMDIVSVGSDFEIKPGIVDKNSGKYSYDSFIKALSLADKKQVSAVVTLPINKKAWSKAGINYKGHTDALRHVYQKDAIMMMGSPNMYIALFTEHIALKNVAQRITQDNLYSFFIRLYESVKFSKCATLGLNPHAGEDGVLGDEDIIIKNAIKKANKTLGHNIYTYPMPADSAFIPSSRNKFTYYVAMYHDQGLIPLKTLYFEESINISLGLPIKRVSVDHGSAYDIAYKNATLDTKSYINAIKYAISTK